MSRTEQIAVALATVVSSYVGARCAADRYFRRPEQRQRVAVAVAQRAQTDSVARLQEQARRQIAARAEVAERRRLDAACYFDFKHAVSNGEIENVLRGYGPAMTREEGDANSLAWIQCVGAPHGEP